MLCAAIVSAQEVPVLLWHGLDEHFGYDPVGFLTQVRWMAAHGVNAITADQLVDWIESGTSLPDRAVLLTFDDTYDTVYTVAYPALTALGMRGINFAHTKYVGVMTGNPHATWDDIRLMERVAVMATESHTVSHLRLTDLGDEELRAELEDSRTKIEAEIPGKTCPYVAYPYGSYDTRVIAAARAAGYRAGFAVLGGRNTRTTPLFELRRIGVVPTTSLSTLASAMGLPSGGEGITAREGDLIIDNDDPGFTTEGSWTSSSSVPGFEGTDYLHADPGATEAVARWNAMVPFTGIYDVCLRYTAHSNRSRHTLARIRHALETVDWEIDQTADIGGWVPVQRCILALEDGADISVRGSSEGYVVADAVLIRPIEAFRVHIASPTPGYAVLSWPGLPGAVYRVASSQEPSGPWGVLTGPVPGLGTGRTSAVTPISDAQHFYRITAETAP